MVLCFGTFATVLAFCSLPGTTNRTIVSTLVGVIDPNNKYADKNSDVAVSRLMNCSANLPSNGSTNAVVQTTAVSLARDLTTTHVAANIRPVLNLLDEDKKATALNALLDLIKNDETLADAHSALFKKCMGFPASEILNFHEINTMSFLAGILLYTVLMNENTTGRQSIAFLKADPAFSRISEYDVRFMDFPHPENSGVVPENVDIYLEKTRDKYNSLRTLIYGEIPRPFYDFYVCNDVERKVRDSNHSSMYHAERISGLTASKLFEISKCTILSGTGGLGKSMMMRHLMLNCIDFYPSTGLIPIYIPLKNYEGQFDNLVDCIYAEVQENWPGLTKDALLSLFASGKSLILFDGLDEIHSHSVPIFTNILDSFLNRYPAGTFVVSSRPYTNFMSFNNRFTVLNLRPFTKSQSLELIDKLDYRSDSPAFKEKFRNLLNNSLYDSHRGFSDNPLLLTIMLMTFEDYGEVASKMHVFYEEAYQVLSKKHDASKDAYTRPLRTGWSTDIFADYFSFFCAVTYREEKIRFTYNDFDIYFRKVKQHYKIDNNVSLDDFIFDLCNNLCLMYQDGTAYTFTHRSFQEYFCAKYFSRQKDKYLSMTISMFDRKSSNKNNDATIGMLYEMIPSKVEEFLVVPYLQKLIDRCDRMDGIWTFLETIYPNLECSDGDLCGDDEGSPSSALYAFILDQYQIELKYINPDDFPGLNDYVVTVLVWREDENSADLIENIPSDYEEKYGHPTVIGQTYKFDWEKIQETPTSNLALAIKKIDSPFMSEYRSIRNLLTQLEDKLNRTGEDMFDYMD